MSTELLLIPVGSGGAAFLGTDQPHGDRQFARAQVELFARSGESGVPRADTLSIELTALDSRLAARDPPEALRARLRGLHDLVGDGLREARDAVRALRNDKLSLATQAGRLCVLHGAALSVERLSRSLRADEALALYRVCDDIFAPWCDRVQAEAQDECAVPRLRDVQHLHCDLVETLDEKRLRHSAGLQRA